VEDDDDDGGNDATEEGGVGLGVGVASGIGGTPFAVIVWPKVGVAAAWPGRVAGGLVRTKVNPFMTVVGNL